MLYFLKVKLFLYYVLSSFRQRRMGSRYPKASSHTILSQHVRVAQWIEQQPSKLWVAGSNPASDVLDKKNTDVNITTVMTATGRSEPEAERRSERR